MLSFSCFSLSCSDNRPDSISFWLARAMASSFSASRRSSSASSFSSMRASISALFLRVSSCFSRFLACSSSLACYRSDPKATSL